MDILTLNIAKLELSPKIQLNEYFPSNFKIYEYNPGNDTFSKQTTVNEVEEWLLAKENGSFVFQCLLCRQEMTFSTVFWRRNHYLNRSHLLTKKHKKNVSSNAVGILFNSSKKFVMCSESIFVNGNLFECMKTVARRDNPLINNRITDRVFCKDYKLFTLDRKTKTLNEFEFQGDIVKFMRIEIRPLFSFFCLFCNKSGISYTWVVEHLNNSKHLKKMGAEKGAILSVRDFNVFLVCCFDKLSSLLYLTHLNSYLEEIVVANDGLAMICSFYTKEGKPQLTNSSITIDVKPISIPNGDVKVESIKIITSTNKFIDEPEREIAANSLEKHSSSTQKSEIIYAFSNTKFQELYAENMLLLMFFSGCKIWCSRCSIPIYTLKALEDHLASQEHANRIRNNEQVGFMCHTCNIFFVELKGDSLSHVHKSIRNRNIIKTISDMKREAITYDTPLNKAILNAYSSLFRNMSEAYKFCCLSCYDLTKKKLMHLSSHESESKHQQNSSNSLFSLCEYCKTIYIIEGDKKSHAYFLREHFATHLHIKNPLNFQVWCASSSSESEPYEISVNTEMFVPRKLLPHITQDSSGSEIFIRFSRYCSQLIHPGVSQKEFIYKEKWTENQLSGNIAFLIPDRMEAVQFTCLSCDRQKMTKSELMLHLFIKSTHNKSQDTFIKFCSICNEIFLSTSLEKLQKHFIVNSYHINKLLKNVGVTPIGEGMRESVIYNCKTVFCSESLLLEQIESRVNEMKETFLDRENISGKIQKDCLKLLSNKFPKGQLNLFGSCNSGLALRKSDCDFSFGIGNENFSAVEQIFLEQNELFKMIESFKLSPYFSVPFIRVQHKETGIQCDISFSSNYEIHVSKLIKLYIDFDERVHWLLAAVRCWAELTELRDPRLLGSLNINFLVLFYLMQPDVRIIPNVSYVLDACGGVDKFLTDKDYKLIWKEEKTNQSTNIDLLEGFFNYFSLMNFEKYKLCLFNGHVIPRSLDEVNTIYLEDPFRRENSFKKSTPEVSQQFRTSCYFTLHMPWRII